MNDEQITSQLKHTNDHITGEISSWKKHVSSPEGILADRATRRTLVLFSAIVALACWFDQIPTKISQFGIRIPGEDAETTVVNGALFILIYLFFAFVRASWTDTMTYYVYFKERRKSVRRAQKKLLTRLHNGIMNVPGPPDVLPPDVDENTAHQKLRENWPDHLTDALSHSQFTKMSSLQIKVPARLVSYLLWDFGFPVGTFVVACWAVSRWFCSLTATVQFAPVAYPFGF